MYTSICYKFLDNNASTVGSYFLWSVKKLEQYYVSNAGRDNGQLVKHQYGLDTVIHAWACMCSVCCWPSGGGSLVKTTETSEC